MLFCNYKGITKIVGNKVFFKKKNKIKEQISNGVNTDFPQIHTDVTQIHPVE